MTEGKTLAADRLRSLTIERAAHPRGQAHVSAASGLVCRRGRAYVIADDEHHLAVFHDRASPGSLHRIAAGDLPHGRKARKRRKPDFESLLWLPGAQRSAADHLLALGSGSRPNRDGGLVIELRRDGTPRPAPRHFDLAALYGPLRARLGEINIEGAFISAGQLVLLHRGLAPHTQNMAVRYGLDDLHAAIAGQRTMVDPLSMQAYELGSIEGVVLGFTDGAALPDGSWVFTAVAEASESSYADGPCRGAAVGMVAANGTLLWLRHLTRAEKIEGMDVRTDASGTVLFMVTDADDPEQPSWLLSARV
ncbi:MAG: hypothetical protein V4792_14645 [Pseudomonadota bacterium]